MPRLLLLRHAKAVAHSPDGDFARELKPRGRSDATRLGRWLLARGHVPDVALLSPSRRTRETAELVLLETGGAPAVRFPENFYNASADTLSAAIDAERAQRLLVVAHKPGVAELALALAGRESRDFIDGFPTCALAIFERAVAKSRWRLVGFTTPATMARES